jgi:hypothetical protein
MRVADIASFIRAKVAVRLRQMSEVWHECFVVGPRVAVWKRREKFKAGSVAINLKLTISETCLHIES